MAETHIMSDKVEYIKINEFLGLCCTKQNIVKVSSIAALQTTGIDIDFFKSIQESQANNGARSF